MMKASLKLISEYFYTNLPETFCIVFHLRAPIA